MTHSTAASPQRPWTPADAGVALPPSYAVLPHAVPFRVPGFLKHGQPNHFVLAPEPIACEEWFARFASRVMQAVGSTYLPICRMSDGEFLLLFGHQPPSPRHPPMQRVWRRVRQYAEIVRRRVRGFRASTTREVSSGVMSYAEVNRWVPILSRHYAEIARDGILGLHLSWGPNPFQEHYFPALGRWLQRQDVSLTVDNYVPFYFVYGLLRGPMFPEVVAGRRVLVVHSATGAKQDAIVGEIRKAHPRGIEWMEISATRSFAETIDLSRIQDKPDICLLGAGVGKAALFPQLRPLAIPCLDAGYSFEAWSDPDKQWDRPFMTPDSVFDAARVRF